MEEMSDYEKALIVRALKAYTYTMTPHHPDKSHAEKLIRQLSSNVAAAAQSR